MSLTNFLNSKPLYYDEIDYDRFPNIYSKIKSSFKLSKIVHIVGTNGKGSTGRALAHLLYAKGFCVGHYSSPHIVKFNERIWLNGLNVNDDDLESTHILLQKILTKEDSNLLSYFEYTTLLAMLIFSKKCDYIILEAGLGGEFDATNVFDKCLSIITPIGLDHESFLGSTIEQIATTKLNSVRSDMILAKQYNNKVYELAYNKINELETNLYLSQKFFDACFYSELEEFVIRDNLPLFFIDNFSTAFCAFAVLGFMPQVRMLKNFKLFGRCQKIESNVTIDVGHNPMAAKAIREYFRGKKVVLVYNSYNDKEYSKILSILKPIIKEVQILSINSQRAVSRKKLENILDILDLKYSTFKKIENDNEYLVFGSFSVVESYVSKK